MTENPNTCKENPVQMPPKALIKQSVVLFKHPAPTKMGLSQANPQFASVDAMTAKLLAELDVPGTSNAQAQQG